MVSSLLMTNFYFYFFYSLKKISLHLHWREKKDGACKEHEPDGIDAENTTLEHAQMPVKYEFRCNRDTVTIALGEE